PLRQSISQLLQSLVESGTLMQVGDEYRLQTRESAEWEMDFQRRRARIRADDSRIASDRATVFHNSVTAALKGITITQGLSKTPRKYETQFGTDSPSVYKRNVTVWGRDEWAISEYTRGENDDSSAIDVRNV